MRALLLLLLLALSGCRLLSGEIACRLNRDCPRDVGRAFCDAPGDGGVGRCVADDPSPPEDDEEEDADAGFVFPFDAG